MAVTTCSKFCAAGGDNKNSDYRAALDDGLDEKCRAMSDDPSKKECRRTRINTNEDHEVR